MLDLLPADPPRLENFVSGSNLEALAAVTASTEESLQVYLWGKEGCGKSHLLQGACRRLSDDGQQVAYIPFAEIKDLDPEMCEGLEEMDVVCLDDVHLIVGQENWQQSVFHLFNRLRDAGNRLLISSACNPSELPLNLPDLKSRLSWGLVLQMSELEEVEKVQALSERARQRGFDLTLEVADYLIKRCPRDMHSLFLMLDRLDEASMQAQRKLTMPFVKKVLGL